MQHDTVIWNVISPGSGGFCSYRRHMPNNPTRFCKNPNNVLGLCTPLACPLANSRYATIREHKGKCYLLMKTIERAHSPAKLWEKVKLSEDYMTALKQIDEHLMWWPSWNKHKCKLRLTKMHQFIIRARKLALSAQPKLTRIWKPYERQQVKRERKAEIAAKITNVIKSELLERLHEGVYEGIYNFPMKQYNQILDENGKQDEMQSESDSDTEFEAMRSTNKKSEKKMNNNNNKNKNENKNTNKKNEEKEKEFEEAAKNVVKAEGNLFVGDYDDSDFEFFESEDETNDIEDFDDMEEFENEQEQELEYEMEDDHLPQPQSLTHMDSMHGQSIKSLNVSKNNKKDNNNNARNGNNRSNRRGNNDNRNGNWSNNNNNNNNSHNENEMFIRSNARQGWNKSWSGQKRGGNNNNSNSSNSSSSSKNSVLGKRGFGTKSKSKGGKKGASGHDGFQAGPPPKKRQRRVKIGYE